MFGKREDPKQVNLRYVAETDQVFVSLHSNSVYLAMTADEALDLAAALTATVTAGRVGA
ncbi:hypothetical protein [Nocardia abscessus]|uniref:hypothetical protein n=1 Tax=Nocardia abscessus TaxID=120957 RepID=UPI002458C4AB|nr:hypothetical protein [Nocardia abscessus]